MASLAKLAALQAAAAETKALRKEASKGRKEPATRERHPNDIKDRVHKKAWTELTSAQRRTSIVFALSGWIAQMFTIAERNFLTEEEALAVIEIFERAKKRHQDNPVTEYDI